MQAAAQLTLESERQASTMAQNFIGPVSHVHSILVFDSGIGGLSVAKEVCQRLPNANVHYLADHAAYPYGDKEDAWLVKRVDRLITQMIKQVQPDLLILACNTASTLALPTLRSHLSIPIVGVVPAIKTAAQITQNHRIGLLATPGTVSRVYIDDLIRQFAHNCQVERLGTTALVHLAEDKLAGKPVDMTLLASATQPLIDKGVDCVVLGCTHFPLLLTELQQLYPDVRFVDSGEAIARRAQQLLSDTPHTNNPSPLIIDSNAIKAFYSTQSIKPELESQLAALGFLDFTYCHFPLSMTP